MSIDPVITDKQFQADNQQLLEDAAKVQADIKQTAADKAAYLKKLDDPNMSSSYALILLFYILGASGQTSTMLGYFTDQGGISGDQLALNGALTATGNDLNNMTQSNNNNPASMYVFGNDTNLLLNELSNAGGAYPNLDPNAANPSMDPQAQNSVFNELKQIRQEFYLNDGSGYDPDPNSPTCYFEPNTSSKIETFYGLQQDLGQQGDPQQATEAAKMMTDNFAANTQTTQTTSAVLNNDQKTYTSMEQTIQSFLASIGQWWNTTVKNANSHMTTS